MRDDAGFFDVDHTKPLTTATQALDRSARSRSAERERLPAATTTTPESTRTTTAPAPDTVHSSRLKSGAGAKGRCHVDLSTTAVFGSRPSDHYFRSVCLSVCLFVCAEFFSAVFDPISIKLGHMLYVWV